MSEEDDFDAMLAELNREFMERLPTTLDEIDSAFAALATNAAPEDPLLLDTLYRLLHSLAGSAGTFGQPLLGEQAKQAEHVVVAARSTGGFSAAERGELANRLAQLRTHLPPQGE